MHLIVVGVVVVIPPLLSLLSVSLMRPFSFFSPFSSQCQQCLHLLSLCQAKNRPLPCKNALCHKLPPDLKVLPLPLFTASFSIRCFPSEASLYTHQAKMSPATSYPCSRLSSPSLGFCIAIHCSQPLQESRAVPVPRTDHIYAIYAAIRS